MSTARTPCIRRSLFCARFALCFSLRSYVRLFIQASPVLCQDIETRLRVDDHVVKTMTIKHKQAAPVVVEKRVTQKVRKQLQQHSNNDDDAAGAMLCGSDAFLVCLPLVVFQHVESSSVTGVLSHAPILEYDVAKALLSLGLLRSDDILALPRYAPDAGWEATRQQELLKRAHGGRSEAARVLQVPIPTRAQDLADMKKLAEKEEAHMQAYEDYRAADIARRWATKSGYIAAEEERKEERLRWYEQQAGQIRTRALIKRLGMSEEKALKLLAKGDPRPAWRNRLRNTLEKNRLRNEEMRGILAELAAEKAQEHDELLAGEDADVTLTPDEVAEQAEEEAEQAEEEAAEAAENGTDALEAEEKQEDEDEDDDIPSDGIVAAEAARQRKLGKQDYLHSIGATPEFEFLNTVERELAEDESGELWQQMEQAILGQSEGELDDLVERWGALQTKLDPDFAAQFGLKGLEAELLASNPGLRREVEMATEEAVAAEEAFEREQDEYHAIAGLSDAERALVNKREQDRQQANATLLDEDASKADRKRAHETLAELAHIDQLEAQSAEQDAQDDLIDGAAEAAETEAAFVASVATMKDKQYADTMAQLERRLGMLQAAADIYESSVAPAENEAAAEETEEDAAEDVDPAVLTRQQKHVLETLRHRAERTAHMRSVLQATRAGTPVAQSLAEFDAAYASLMQDRQLQAREDFEVAAAAFDAARTPAAKREAAVLLAEAEDNVPWDPVVEEEIERMEQQATRQMEAQASGGVLADAAGGAAQEPAAQEQEEQPQQEPEPVVEEPPQQPVRRVQPPPSQKQQKKKPQRSPRK